MPTVKIKVPTPLKTITNGAGAIEGDGKTIKELLFNLESNFPGIAERLLDNEGNIRKFINLYLNDEDIRFMKGVDTELTEGDTISIIPAIAGGNS